MLNKWLSNYFCNNHQLFLSLKPYGTMAHSGAATSSNSNMHMTRHKQNNCLWGPHHHRMFLSVLAHTCSFWCHPFLCLSQLVHPQPLIPLPFAGDGTFWNCFLYVTGWCPESGSVCNLFWNIWNSNAARAPQAPWVTYKESAMDLLRCTLEMLVTIIIALMVYPSLVSWILNSLWQGSSNKFSTPHPCTFCCTQGHWVHVEHWCLNHVEWSVEDGHQSSLLHQFVLWWAAWMYGELQ